jgi:galactonate dehydratase
MYSCWLALMGFIDISSSGKNLKVPIYELLGGKVRNQVQVYCWIGGDRPADVEKAAYVL